MHSKGCSKGLFKWTKSQPTLKLVGIWQNHIADGEGFIKFFDPEGGGELVDHVTLAQVLVPSTLSHLVPGETSRD